MAQSDVHPSQCSSELFIQGKLRLRPCASGHCHPPFLSNRQFLNRDDIGIILINQYIAEMVRHALDAHQRSIPAVLEIPSKEHPYDAAKDSILRRAKGMFTAEDLR